MTLITRIDRSEPAPSPFLPETNIQYAWDSTSLGYLKTCPRLYQYIMIDGWGEKDQSIHLYFGIEYHQALQDYSILVAQDISHDDALRDVTRSVLERTFGWSPDPDTKAGKYKNRKTLIRSVIWYLDKFKDDPAETFILEDGTPAVELSFRFELDWGPSAANEDEATCRARDNGNFGEVIDAGQPYLLSGHLDRVVSFSDSLFVMDHKTTTIAPSQYYFNQFDPSNQMTLYTLASQIVLNSPIKGVIINAVQLLIDETRYARGFTYRTPDRLEEWTNDLRYWLESSERYAIDNYWPQNDTACDKFGGCKFREVCSKSPGVREQFLKADFVKLAPEERWNPLKPR